MSFSSPVLGAAPTRCGTGPLCPNAFPSATINLTPISFSGSDNLAISARASTGSDPRRPVVTPRAPPTHLLRNRAQIHHRRAIDADAVGRLADRALAAQ